VKVLGGALKASISPCCSSANALMMPKRMFFLDFELSSVEIKAFSTTRSEKNGF
jgi:hypothetical protein